MADSFDDHHRRGAGRNGLQLVGQRIRCEIDRNAQQWIRRSRDRQPLILVSDQLRLIQLEPDTARQPECATVETATEHDHLQARFGQELVPQEVVDIPMSGDITDVRAGLAAEQAKDLQSPRIHELPRKPVAADRAGTLRITHPHAAAVERRFRDGFHCRSPSGRFRADSVHPSSLQRNGSAPDQPAGGITPHAAVSVLLHRDTNYSTSFPER